MTGYISKNKADWLFQEIFCDEEYCGGSCYKCGKEAQYRNKLLQEPDANVQPVNQWVSTKDRLPEESDEYLAVVDGVIMEVSYNPKQKGLICVWSTCDADGFRPLPDDAVTHWMPMPEAPTND